MAASLIQVRADIAPTGGTERTPPTEFKIFGFGDVSTTKGQFKFTPEACDVLLAERAAHAADVQIDYDHQAIEPKTPGDGKAAGWCHLEKREDGLYAVDVKWTPAAAEMLKNGEYRYFSPYFGATKDTKQIVMLMNVAITNLPAMHEIEALVAANVLSHPSKEAAQKQESAINISKARKAGHHIPQKGKDGSKMAHKLGGYLAKELKGKGITLKAMADKAGMHEDRMRALHDGEDPTPEEMKSIGAAMGMKDGELEEHLEGKAASSLDNGDDDLDGGKEGDKIAKDKASRKARGDSDEMNLDLVELTGTTDKAKQRAKLAAVFAAAEQFVGLKAELDSSKKKMDIARREQLIEKGKAEGKLTPSLIRFWATRALNDFEEFLKGAPMLSVQNLALREGESTAAAAVLTSSEIDVCRLTNSSPDKMAQFVNDERSGKNRQLIYDTYYGAQN